MMEYYARVAGEGLSLTVALLLAVLYGSIVLLVAPFFILGLIKRGLISMITGGDPLVP